MAENPCHRGLLALLVTLKRPRGGIRQLFLLEASEVAAGQVQEIAGQRNNLGAQAIQRFMDQIIVIAVTGAFVQAQDAIGIPTAVAHKASEKIVTAGDAVDGAALGGVQYLKNSLPEFWRDALIGIDHQHPVAGGVILRALALNAIASPVGMGIDLGAEAAGQLNGVVGAAGVEDDNFIRPANGAQTIRQQVGGVFSDHHHGKPVRH